MADYRDQLWLIPSHMRDGVSLYVEQGIEPGSFLYSVLSNDLKGSFLRADEMNKRAMVQWVEFVYWHLPSECQGSPEKVDAWIERGGLRGFSMKSDSKEQTNGDQED
jgi:hypothetical protein